jgi:hypothetical protein
MVPALGNKDSLFFFNTLCLLTLIITVPVKQRNKFTSYSGANTHYGDVVRYYGAREVTEEHSVIKVNLYVFTPLWHVRGVEVWLHSFLNSTLVGDECSTLRPDRYTR